RRAALGAAPGSARARRDGPDRLRIARRGASCRRRAGRSRRQGGRRPDRPRPGRAAPSLCGGLRRRRGPGRGRREGGVRGGAAPGPVLLLGAGAVTLAFASDHPLVLLAAAAGAVLLFVAAPVRSPI